MRYRKDLYHLINCIIAAPPKLGLTLLNKVDLSNTHIHIWVRLEDINSLSFLVPKTMT